MKISIAKKTPLVFVTGGLPEKHTTKLLSKRVCYSQKNFLHKPAAKRIRNICFKIQFSNNNIQEHGLGGEFRDMDRKYSRVC